MESDKLIGKFVTIKVKTNILSFKSFFRFGSFAALLISLLLLINIGGDKEEDRAITKNNPAESEEPLLITQPVVQEFDNDSLKFRLLADKAQIFERTQITRLHSIQIHLLDVSSTVIKTRIIARSGEISSESGIMHLWGRVLVNTSDGQILQTEEVFLNQKQNVMYNDSVVKVTSGDDVIVASAMHYNMTNGVLTLRKPEANIEL